VTYCELEASGLDRDRCPALVNTLMNLRLPKEAGNFLISWVAISFPRRALLQEVFPFFVTHCTYPYYRCNSVLLHYIVTSISHCIGKVFTSFATLLAESGLQNNYMKNAVLGYTSQAYITAICLATVN